MELSSCRATGIIGKACTVPGTMEKHNSWKLSMTAILGGKSKQGAHRTEFIQPWFSAIPLTFPFSSNIGTLMSHGSKAESIFSTCFSEPGERDLIDIDLNCTWTSFNALTPSYSKISLQGYEAEGCNLNKY